MTMLLKIAWCALIFGVIEAHSTEPHNVSSIGVLVNLHEGPQCESLVPTAVQQLMAAKWAAEAINNQTARTYLEIQILDTCKMKGEDGLKKALELEPNKPLVGIIGLGHLEQINPLISTLKAFSVPIILALPQLAEMIPQVNNVFTTAPTLSSLIMPTVSLAEELGAPQITLISSCPITIQQFPEISSKKGITLAKTLKVVKNSKIIGEIIKKFIEDISPDMTLVLILEPEEVTELAEYLRSHKFRKSMMITATIGLNKNLIKLWKSVFANSYLIEPHIPELPDYKNYLQENLKTAGEKNNTMLKHLVEKNWKCQWDSANSSETYLSCNNLSMQDIIARLQIDPEIIFTVKGVSAYSAALLLVNNGYEHSCHEEIRNCVLSVLQDLSLASLTQVMNKNGHIVSNRYVILHIGRVADLIAVGWYSDENGLVMDWTQPNKYQFKKEDSNARGLHLVDSVTEHNLDNYYDVNIQKVSYDHYVLRAWSNIMVALSSIGLLITVFMVVYVCLKLYDGTLSGNQSLGIVLLFAIFIIYLSIILIIPSATGIKCVFRQLIYPMAMTVCYAILLVKVMQLRSLVLLGLGGRISYLNQYLVLFFIVLVQGVLCVQMVFSDRTWTVLQSDGSISCTMSLIDFLTLHVYSGILASLSFIYGLSVLKIRRNYKEGRWVTIASGLSLPVLIGWTILKFLAPNKIQELVTCISLLVLATILVTAIFLPKMSTISKQVSRTKHKMFTLNDPVFTTFTELHSQVTKSNYSMAEYVTKNPIYQATNSAYP